MTPQELIAERRELVGELDREVSRLQEEVTLLRTVEFELGTMLTSTAERYFPVIRDSTQGTWLQVMHFEDGWVVNSYTEAGPVQRYLDWQISAPSLVEALCLLGEKRK